MTTLQSLSAVLLSLVVLAGCASSSKTPAAAVPSAAAGVVEGKIYYLHRIALPAESKLTVKLLDVTNTAKPITLAEYNRVIGMQTPAPFTLKFNPKSIRPDGVYQVLATLDAAGQIWTHEQAYPVLTGNYPAYVEIRLSPSRVPN